jgi:hypothetical protein
MDGEDAAAFARRIITFVMGTAPVLDGRDQCLRDIRNWDSMKHLQFILALEHEFDLTLAPEDIESLVTVGNVEDLARARTA